MVLALFDQYSASTSSPSSVESSADSTITTSVSVAKDAAHMTRESFNALAAQTKIPEYDVQLTDGMWVGFCNMVGADASGPGLNLTFFENFCETNPEALVQLHHEICNAVVFARCGARFSAEIYTLGCHWFPRLLATSEQACAEWHSSRVFTFLTGAHCKLRPNTEGRSNIKLKVLLGWRQLLL
jgi:hypothetical protein